ncbi:MAG: heme A synthase, partial [Eudoraea sp.]|nr:heme A synthase [Eudoraea sp.]
VSDKKTNVLLWLALGLTMIQIVIGTQVRQFIDDQISFLGEQAKELWLLEPQLQFYIHRSFSILVVLLNVFIAYTIYKKNLKLSKMNWVLSLLGIEILTGMGMYYLDFPFGSQALHLVIASLLFGVQFYLVLETQKAKIRVETL